MNIKRKIRQFFIYRKLKNCKTTFERPVHIGKHIDISESMLAEEVRIASYASVRNTKVGFLSSIGRFSKVTHSNIGKFCAISWDVTINAIGHPLENLSISAFPYVPHVGDFVEKRDQEHSEVIVGNDVWIGANSVIMPNLKIGNGAIIGAGSVVTKDVPDYAIVAGVPAKLIRYRFDHAFIKTLVELKWWNLDRKILKENIALFKVPLNQEVLSKLDKLCKS